MDVQQGVNGVCDERVLCTQTARFSRSTLPKTEERSGFTTVRHGTSLTAGASPSPAPAPTRWRSPGRCRHIAEAAFCTHRPNAVLACPTQALSLSSPLQPCTATDSVALVRGRDCRRGLHVHRTGADVQGLCTRAPRYDKRHEPRVCACVGGGAEGTVCAAGLRLYHGSACAVPSLSSGVGASPCPELSPQYVTSSWR